MVELVPVAAAVVTCVAEASAIDRLAASTSETVVRIAPDEALVVATDGARSAADAAAAVAGLDADAIVLDTTDGWAALALEGEDAEALFARLSQLAPGHGVAQGEVAHVPATIVAGPGGIVLLIPAMWRDAVRERILADGASLGIAERTEPRPWTASPQARS